MNRTNLHIYTLNIRKAIHFFVSSHVGGSQDFSHGNYLDELAADIRCYLIEIVTMWTVLTVTSVDLEELKQLTLLAF